ncbi:hypothetical protein PIB30_044669 [Stylosanthes scabra]|uniref:Secreted protein n=1 Tax=Stylosanthes scabra TaxID=79078 RepID=A0ABU6ZEP2_9FABA|nr:hypothetical protein [Stylosanthes scabra]
MRSSIIVVAFLMVLAASTRPSLVNCRVLIESSSPQQQQHVKEVQTSKQANFKEDNTSIGNKNSQQFHTMSSGPSGRGEGH